MGLVELTDLEKAEFLKKAVQENIEYCKNSDKSSVLVDEGVANIAHQENSTKSRWQFYESLHDVRESSLSPKLSRALSAPSLFSDSFDENENVNSGTPPDCNH